MQNRRSRTCGTRIPSGADNEGPLRYQGSLMSTTKKSICHLFENWKSYSFTNRVREFYSVRFAVTPLQSPYKHRTVASRCLSHFGFILLFGYSLDLVRQYTRHPAVHFDASVIVWAVMFAASPRSSAESNVSATRPISCPEALCNFEVRKPASSSILVRSTPSLVGFLAPASAGSRT